MLRPAVELCMHLAIQLLQCAYPRYRGCADPDARGDNLRGYDTLFMFSHAHRPCKFLNRR